MNTVSLEVMSPRLATVFTAVADNFAIIAFIFALVRYFTCKMFL